MTPYAAPELTPDVRAALPTFLVIGAPKAGTTSLHSYLATHPEIAMSSNKEPMCFVRTDWTGQLARYRELFEVDRPVRGESSTAYSAYPWAPDVPDRVRATIPEARMIYLVRDPISRTLAQYAQNVWDRFPVKPFEELLEDLEDPLNQPIWGSRYATQLERWTERFGADRVLVVDADDLRADRRSTMRRILGFLGVDADFVSPGWDAEHNTADTHRVRSDLAGRLGRLEPWVARVPIARRALTREVPKPTLTAAQRHRLEDVLRPEIERLREITGQRFAGWSI